MTPPPRRHGPEAATAQVSRMLALVPYITRRPGVTVAELSAEFGVGTAQILADLSLLMVCGEPGYYPNELIDVVLDEDGGTVSIAYDAGIDRPVRLSQDEAVTLLVALRTLADLPGLLDADAVHSLIAKLESAGGEVGGAITVAPPESGPALAAVRTALDTGRRLHLRYYTASRDAVTERDVDPIRLLVVGGHSYVEGYCYRAEAIRRFRVDRIDDVAVLEQPAQQALWVDDDVPATLFAPRPGVHPVTVHLARPAGWVAEYYAADILAAETEDGGTTVALSGADDEWLVRLVLSLGGHARILDREDLAAEVRARAVAALAAYGVPPEGAAGAAAMTPPPTA